MKCLICGLEFQDLGSHLRFDHHVKAKSYYDQYLKKPEDGLCKCCGKPTKFLTINSGYRSFCSKKCKNDSYDILQEKMKLTCLERYGVENASQSEEIRNKIKQTNLERYGCEYAIGSEKVKKKIKESWKNKSEEEKEAFRKKKSDAWKNRTPDENKSIINKMKQTNLERYGCEIASQSDEVQRKMKQTCLKRYGYENPFKDKNIQEKIKQTNLERYGVYSPAQSDQIMNKMKQTNLEKYGVEFYSCTDEFKSHISHIRRNHAIGLYPNVIDIIDEGDDMVYVCKCSDRDCSKKDECEGVFNIKSNIFYTRKYQGIDLCTIKHPVSQSMISGTSLEVFIREILDKANISYETNNRKILKGKEVDIYIPDKNIAIECNGIYWHSKKDSEYHYNKWKSCLDQGIQLLTIWEDQIYRTPEIIENIILSNLGIYEHKIGARSCEVKNVKSSEAAEFMNKYHMQGFVSGSEYIGLYYKEELISLMIFGKKRVVLGNKKPDENVYELYRFCNKTGWQVTGGASKIFKYFLQKYPEVSVESFSSNDISSGGLYKKLGFKKASDQKSSYWYIDKDMNRHHRWSFRKDMLVKNGADPNLTEEQITMDLGLMRIYDSGQQKWIFKNK